MKKIVLSLLLLYYSTLGYSQCQFLNLNSLTNIYNLKLDDREDNLIEKGFEFIENREGEKLFGKCKKYLHGEVSYDQYILIGNSIMVYSTENAQAYLSIKKLVKEKLKVNPEMSDAKSTYYSDGKILIRFEVINSQDRPLYFLYFFNA